METGRDENLLLDRPAPQAPNEVFIGDITYIPLRQGTFLYLACWQDMFSRKIVGWELADNMRSELVIKALNKAIARRKLPEKLIIHSDGGGQYASEDFRKLVAKQHFVQSMTRKDNHYDNAMAESLFSRFKAELMDKGAFACFEDAYTEIFEYIEIYYNRKRRHSGINYQIPDQFEQKWDYGSVDQPEKTGKWVGKFRFPLFQPPLAGQKFWRIFARPGHWNVENKRLVTLNSDIFIYN